MNRGQAAFEYLLLIGAGVLVSAILLVIVTSAQTTTTDVAQADTQDFSGRLKNLLSTGSTDCRYCDGIFVGTDKENSITSAMIVDGAITTSDINPSQIQLRITKDCGTQAISKIDATGNATCIPITASGGTDFDWATSGSNIYANTTGNVGIGTTSPGFKLDVKGIANIGGTSYNYLLAGLSTSGYTTTFNMTDAGLSIGHNSASRSLSLRTNSLDRITISSSGNIGIGTTNPTSKLTVNGTLNVTNNRITGLAAPTDANDATTKEYVDASNDKGMYEVCYILNTTASHAACATGYTMLAHYYGGDTCWTIDTPLGATNALGGAYFTFGDAAMGFDVGFAHYTYTGYVLVDNWGSYNIGGGDCAGYSSWPGVVSPVVLVTLNNQGYGYNSRIYKQYTQTMAVCCK